MEDNLNRETSDKQKKFKGIKLLKVQQHFFQNAKALSPKKISRPYSIKNPYFSRKGIEKGSLKSLNFDYPNKTEEIKDHLQKYYNLKSPKKLKSSNRVHTFKFRESYLTKKFRKKSNEEKKNNIEKIPNKIIRSSSPKKYLIKKSLSCQNIDIYMNKLSSGKNNNIINVKKVSSKKSNNNNKIKINKNKKINNKNKIKNKNIINEKENEINKNSINVIKIKNENTIENENEQKNKNDKKNFKKFFCCL